MKRRQFMCYRITALALMCVLSALPVLGDSCTASAPSGGATPLTDFAPGQTYKGFPGFLYDGSNNVPADHDADGRTLAGNIHAINGKIVFLGIGMSNATIE